MKIDTHLHVMLSPFYARQPTDPERLLADLAECGLDGGWVSSIDALTTRDLNVQRRSNDSLAEMAHRYPGRIMGLATVDPNYMDEAEREVERSVRELGLLGVKLHPWLQAFSVTHPGMDAIMAAAGAIGAPVLFHDGTPPYSTPRQIAWLAAKHPQTQVILGHAGLFDMWRDASDAARQQPNLWLQPAAAPPVAVRAALAAVGPERLLFGTDGGFGSVRFMRYAMNRFRCVLGDELLQQVMAQNPARILAAARPA